MINWGATQSVSSVVSWVMTSVKSLIHSPYKHRASRQCVPLGVRWDLTLMRNRAYIAYKCRVAHLGGSSSVGLNCPSLESVIHSLCKCWASSMSEPSCAPAELIAVYRSSNTLCKQRLKKTSREWWHLTPLWGLVHPHSKHRSFLLRVYSGVSSSVTYHRSLAHILYAWMLYFRHSSSHTHKKIFLNPPHSHSSLCSAFSEESSHSQ